MEESKIVILNMCLYVGLFAYSFWKYKWRNLTTILSLLYAVSSVASYLLYKFPLYSVTITSQGKATLPACLYLFLLNFLLITAFVRCNIDECTKLTRYDESFVTKCIKVLVVLLGISLLFSLPASIGLFFSGQDLADLRNASYDLSGRIKLPFAISIIWRLFNALPLALLSCVAIRYFMLRRFTKWDKLGIYVYALTKISTILGVISRAAIVFSLLEVFFLLMLFYDYMTERLKRKIIRVGTIVGVGLFFIFTAISAARFSDGTAKDLNAELANLRYTGEAQLDFMTLAYPDLKEPFMGYRMFPLYRRILGLDYYDGKSRDSGDVYDSVISKKFHFPHPPYIFYGLSGDLYINFGLWGALAICLLIHVLVRKQFKRQTSASLMQLIVTTYLVAYVGKGAILTDYGNEAGNMMILFLIMATIYLRSHGKSYPVIRAKQ